MDTKDTKKLQFVEFGNLIDDIHWEVCMWEERIWNCKAKDSNSLHKKIQKEFVGN